MWVTGTEHLYPQTAPADHVCHGLVHANVAFPNTTATAPTSLANGKKNACNMAAHFLCT